MAKKASRRRKAAAAVDAKPDAPAPVSGGLGTVIKAVPSPVVIAPGPVTFVQKTPHLPRISIECPLGEVGEDEYLSRHVESRFKTHEQQLNMKRLVRGLQQSGAKTKDGRPVERPGEAIRWIMEKITPATEASDARPGPA